MNENGAVALVVWFFTTVVALAILWLLFRGRGAAGLKMIMGGIVLAFATMWYGLVSGMPNRQGLPIPLGNPALADISLRLAAVLILGGIVAILLVHDSATVSYYPPEPPRNVPPSV